MKMNMISVVSVMAFTALCCPWTIAEDKTGQGDYTEFSRWGVTFDFPKEWQEYPPDRVNMMKEYLQQEFRPYGLELTEFAMIVGPKEETALLVSKYTTTRAMKPSEFIEERNKVYEDAKKAGDVTKVNHIKEVTISKLPSVEEDVERSNGGRGRTFKVINGTTVFEISFVVNNKSQFPKYSPTLDHIVGSVKVAEAAMPPKKEGD